MHLPTTTLLGFFQAAKGALLMSDLKSISAHQKAILEQCRRVVRLLCQIDCTADFPPLKRTFSSLRQLHQRDAVFGFECMLLTLTSITFRAAHAIELRQQGRIAS